MEMNFNLSTLFKLYKDYEIAVKENERGYISQEERTAAYNAYVKSPSYNKLETLLKEAQGKARERLVTIPDILGTISNLNTCDCPKNALAGTKITCCPSAHVFPRAYKQIPHGTYFTALFDGKKWILTSVYRYGCNQAFKVWINFSDTAKAGILEKLSKQR